VHAKAAACLICVFARGQPTPSLKRVAALDDDEQTRILLAVHGFSYYQSMFPLLLVLFDANDSTRNSSARMARGLGIGVT
jgi:hypothetical protein